MAENTHDLIRILQASLAPVTVISGAALLLSSMTTRYGRTSDRIRTLLKITSESVAPEAKKVAVTELQLLFSRARLIRTEIICTATSIFCVVVTIFFLFAQMGYDLPVSGIAQFFFLLSLTALIAAMTCFIGDIMFSLQAIKVCIGAQMPLKEAYKQNWRVKMLRRRGKTS